MSMEISTTRTEHPVDDARLAEILANPGFGIHFTDHMFTVEWTPAEGWHDARVTPYGPLTLDPATAVLHYAQEIFEGMKAYRHQDGSIWAFRPEENAARMVRSTHRLALPPLDVGDFVQAVEALVEVDQRWVPQNDQEGEKSLYVRPFMFASEAFLGVRPAQHVTFMVIASPAGSYFKGGIKPVSLWLSEGRRRGGGGHGSGHRRGGRPDRGGPTASPAFAVTSGADGSVSLAVYRLDDAADLEAALGEHGIDATVHFVPTEHGEAPPFEADGPFVHDAPGPQNSSGIDDGPSPAPAHARHRRSRGEPAGARGGSRRGRRLRRSSSRPTPSCSSGRSPSTSAARDR